MSAASASASLLNSFTGNPDSAKMVKQYRSWQELARSCRSISFCILEIISIKKAQRGEPAAKISVVSGGIPTSGLITAVVGPAFGGRESTGSSRRRGGRRPRVSEFRGHFELGTRGPNVAREEIVDSRLCSSHSPRFAPRPARGSSLSAARRSPSPAACAPTSFRQFRAPSRSLRLSRRGDGDVGTADPDGARAQMLRVRVRNSRLRPPPRTRSDPPTAARVVSAPRCAPSRPSRAARPACAKRRGRMGQVVDMPGEKVRPGPRIVQECGAVLLLVRAEFAPIVAFVARLGDYPQRCGEAAGAQLCDHLGVEALQREQPGVFGRQRRNASVRRVSPSNWLLISQIRGLFPRDQRETPAASVSARTLP